MPKQMNVGEKAKHPSIYASNQLILFELVLAVLGIATAYKRKFIYNVTMPDTLKRRVALSILFTAAFQRQTAL